MYYTTKTKKYAIESAKNSSGWICFVNGEDWALPIETTERKAIFATIKHIKACERKLTKRNFLR